MGEALVLATRAGLDPRSGFQRRQGRLRAARSSMQKPPMMIGRNFKPGFRIRLHQKDLRNALLELGS
jgi:2-hydroxy-3-oxopropionate reductase